jgi:hypothetical protein
MCGRRLATYGLLLLFCTPPARADEARLSDGRRVAGALTLDGEGRLRFTPASRPGPLPSDAVAAVRLGEASPPAPPLRAGAVRRVGLRTGERLTGVLLGLDGAGVRLRTAWAESLELPRAAASAVTQPPGWRTVAFDDFRDRTAAWAVEGRPVIGRDAPEVVLERPGQSLAYRLPAPPRAGRVGVNVEDRGAAGARWRLQARFDSKPEPWALSVDLPGPGDAYEVDAPEIAGTAQRVPRSPGWHRLEVQFTPRSLRVLCDDAVLWYTLRQGPPGVLREVRLACEAGGGAAAPRGGVAFAEFAVDEAADEAVRPPTDPGQDEVWTAAGDQWFGKVAAADRRSVTLDARFGRRAFGWGDVRGVFLCRSADEPRTTDGAHARLLLRSGAGPEPDVLEGVVSRLDEHGLTLRHRLLGERALPRARVEEVRPLFFGRRVELDNGPHQLGAAGRLVDGVDPPRAEGPSWRAAVRLDGEPAEARLVVRVTRLAGMRDPEGAILRAGGLRTEVVVNGKVVDYLNRQVERAAAGPRRLDVPLPRGALRPGENRIELRQTPDAGGHHAPCGLDGVALDLPR